MSANHSLYSLENLNNIYDSDKSIIEQIILVFKQNVPVYANDLKNALETKDWARVAFTAHKLKSTLKLFKIDTALEDIVSIEQDAKALVNLDSIPVKIENVINIIEEVKAHLESMY